MTKSRAELDKLLADLEAELPAIEAETDADGFMETFAREAEIIERAAGPADVEHVRSRVSCMLASRGLIPGDSEGERCS